jgi:hypothetical protein
MSMNSLALSLFGVCGFVDRHLMEPLALTTGPNGPETPTSLEMPFERATIPSGSSRLDGDIVRAHDLTATRRDQQLQRQNVRVEKLSRSCVRSRKLAAVPRCWFSADTRGPINSRPSVPSSPNERWALQRQHESRTADRVSPMLNSFEELLPASNRSACLEHRDITPNFYYSISQLLSTMQRVSMALKVSTRSKIHPDLPEPISSGPEGQSIYVVIHFKTKRRRQTWHTHNQTATARDRGCGLHECIRAKTLGTSGSRCHFE